MLSALSTIYLMLQGTRTLHNEMSPGTMQHAQIYTCTKICIQTCIAFLFCVFILLLSHTQPKHWKIGNNSTDTSIFKLQRGTFVTSKKASGMSYYMCMPRHTHTDTHISNKHMKDCPSAKRVHLNTRLNDLKVFQYLCLLFPQPLHLSSVESLSSCLFYRSSI